MAENYDLSRYKEAQAKDFEIALNEIKAGQKKSHWMWYIFPQITGLGESRSGVLHSIKDLEEAKAYIADEELGKNLIKCCEELLKLETNDATKIFGTPNDIKLQQSMTLFKEACPENDIFQKVLDKFFEGKSDRRTREIISWRM